MKISSVFGTVCEDTELVFVLRVYALLELLPLCNAGLNQVVREDGANLRQGGVATNVFGRMGALCDIIWRTTPEEDADLFSLLPSYFTDLSHAISLSACYGNFHEVEMLYIYIISSNKAVLPPSISKYCSETCQKAECFNCVFFFCRFPGRGNSFTTMKTTELLPEILQSGWKSKCAHNLHDFCPSFWVAQLQKRRKIENRAKLHSAVFVCHMIFEKPPCLTLNFWHRLYASAVFITPCLHTSDHLTAVSSVHSCSPLVSLFFLTSASALSLKLPQPPPPPRIACIVLVFHFVFPLALMALQGRRRRKKKRVSAGLQPQKGHDFSSYHRNQTVQTAPRRHRLLLCPSFSPLLITSIVCSLMPNWCGDTQVVRNSCHRLTKWV